MAGVTFLLILCGFAAWAANLAEKRGLATWPHAALGFFLGPLGVLVTALRSPSHAVANVPAGATKRCPFCAEMIQPTARICRYCNRNL